MAESTCSKSNMDQIEDNIARLTSSQINMSTKINDLLHCMAQLETNQPSPVSSATTPYTQSPTSAQHRMKLEVPRFDDTDPMGWIFKITQFFYYHSTSDHERLTITSFYMDGPTLAWFQWMSHNTQLSSWSALIQALEARFALSSYEDPTGLLFKLTQQGTVTEYLSEFESLANCIVGLPAQFLLSCFISRLTVEIRHEVQALQPLMLTQEASLARL